MHITLHTIFIPSEDVVAREIEGETILVPLTAGIGNVDDELYSLNPTGREIWRNFDGKRTLKEIASVLAKDFNAPLSDIENDVLGFVLELARRGMVVEKSVSKSND